MDLHEYVKEQFEQIHERLDHIDRKLDSHAEDLTKHKTLWTVAGAIIMLIIGQLISHTFGG